MSYLLLTGSGGKARYELKGRVHVHDGQWFDATGPVHMFFHSIFQLINLMATNRPEALRALDAVARVGSGVRFFTRIGADYDIVGQHPYFSDPFFAPNCEIDTDMCREYLAPTLDEVANRGLKACTTMGSLSKTDNIEMAFHDMCADIIVESGHEETIAIAEHRNEPDQTSQYRGVPPLGWALAKRTMQAFKAKVGCLISGGSWGDNDSMLAASDGMDMIDYHEHRSMPECIHHIHTAWNDWMFHRKNGGKAMWGGERPGPNAPYEENTRPRPHASLGGDMYVGNDNPELQWGVVAQAGFTGQGTAWLNGPGVRHRVPIDSTTYGWRELPELLHAFIPNDVGLWRGGNPTWRTSGLVGDKRFLYAGLHEWNQIGNPPRPIATWQAIGPYGVTDSGEGQIAISDPNWIYRLIIGEFA